MKPKFKDEIEWFDQETSYLDKIVPFLKNHYLKIMSLILILILLYRYLHVFLVIIFSFITSYIKFKRLKIGIPIEIEPSYLFAIVLIVAYGIPHALLFLFISTLPALIGGMSTGIIINVLNKLMVMFGVYYIWQIFGNTSYVLIAAITFVIISDIVGYFLRLKVGQPFVEILLTVFTNSFFRILYFSFLLEPMIILLG